VVPVTVISKRLTQLESHRDNNYLPDCARALHPAISAPAIRPAPRRLQPADIPRPHLGPVRRGQHLLAPVRPDHPRPPAFRRPAAIQPRRRHHPVARQDRQRHRLKEAYPPADPVTTPELPLTARTLADTELIEHHREPPF